MAQATKQRSRKTPSANGSKPKASTKSTAKKTQGKRSPAKQSSAGARKSKSTGAGASRSRSSSGSSSAKSNGAAAIPSAAVERTKSAGRVVADAAAKAKTPLIAGGTAIAGAAAGVAMKNRLGLKRSKNPFKRMGKSSLTKSAAKLDLKSVQSAAERVSAYGRQASDIAAAMEKTRKKND